MLTNSDLKLGGEFSRDAVSFYELHSGSPFHLPVLAKFASASAHGKPASAKLEFLGKSLFIPIFFVVTGFLINPVTFVRGVLDNFLLVASIVGALLLGKWMAAWAISQAFGYTLDEQLTIWSLTLPQVAATLAATLVAHETLGEAGQPLSTTACSM